MKFVFSRFLIRAIGLGALLLAGCATVNTVEPANPQATPNRVNDKRVITDSNLNSIAYVEGVEESVVSGNLKRIQVRIHNLTAAVKNVNYQFRWYDQQGMAIDSPSLTWHVVSIEGGQTIPITSTAPTPDAVDWQLSLLENVGR
jgi:uncharacterized protein YcfL